MNGAKRVGYQKRTRTPYSWRYRSIGRHSEKGVVTSRSQRSELRVHIRESPDSSSIAEGDSAKIPIPSVVASMSVARLGPPAVGCSTWGASGARRATASSQVTVINPLTHSIESWTCNPWSGMRAVQCSARYWDPSVGLGDSFGYFQSQCGRSLPLCSCARHNRTRLRPTTAAGWPEVSELVLTAQNAVNSDDDDHIGLVR